MATSRSRNSDLKLLAGATVAVLLVGFFIAGAALVATRGQKSPQCGVLNVGSAAEQRKTLDSGGPEFLTGGAACSFYLALDSGDIVAYKVKQPNGCTLKLKRDHWECGGQTVDPATFATYRVSIQRTGDVDAVIVDLRQNPPTTPSIAAPTTTATSSRPRP